MDDKAMMFGNPCKPNYIDTCISMLAQKYLQMRMIKVSICTVQVNRNICQAHQHKSAGV